VPGEQPNRAELQIGREKDLQRLFGILRHGGDHEVRFNKCVIDPPEEVAFWSLECLHQVNQEIGPNLLPFESLLKCLQFPLEKLLRLRGGDRPPRIGAVESQVPFGIDPGAYDPVFVESQLAVGRANPHMPGFGQDHGPVMS
jgi:hypothetical protein